MQREIKFRVWDIKGKKLYYPDLIAISRIGAVRIGIDVNFLPGDSVVQQFTGLKDKSGKDIYEGDIVKFTTNNTDNLSMESVGQIYFDEYRVMIKDIRYKWPNPPADDFDWLRFYRKWDKEVIGNIFENPELLNN